MRRPLLEAAARPIDGASIAVFRIAFGVFMVVDVGIYLPQLVTEYYVDTTFNFAYDPWGLVRPLPGPFAMHLVYVAMAIAGGLIAVGLWYRWAAAAFFFLTTYVFLLDSTFYQNHEYLISLLALALIVLPTHRMWSLDARRRPAIAAQTQPAWVLWFLRFQLGIPYVFGGVAKLNPDWLAGEPLRSWLAARTHVEVIGRWFTNEGVVWFANYGSLLLDLTVVGFLLNRRTRAPAFAIAVAFHLLNARLFGLFVFPWLMIAATTLFFDPDWPLRARDRWRAWQSARHGAASTSAAAPAVVGARVPAAVGAPAARPEAADATAPRAGGEGRAPGSASATFDGTTASAAGQRLAPGLAAVLAVWILVQVVVPFRHLAIPGDANWTEEGHRFAWHMMLRAKSGTVTFTVDDGQERWVEDPLDHISETQLRRLPGHPERLARFAHHLSDLYDGAEVRADTSVALNGRAPAPIVDPEVDLSTVQVPWWGHAEWIVPNPGTLRPDRGR